MTRVSDDGFVTELIEVTITHNARGERRRSQCYAAVADAPAHVYPLADLGGLTWAVEERAQERAVV